MDDLLHRFLRFHLGSLTITRNPFLNRTATMASDDEVDPLSIVRSASHQTLQNLLFPRSRAIFMPLTSPATLRRNSSFRYSFGSRPEPSRHRSQALLERIKTPAHSWDKFRKSDDELRGIRKKKVRLFYEQQVCITCEKSRGVNE